MSHVGYWWRRPRRLPNDLIAISIENRICALSSVGRATRLHREGRGFKSLSAHQANDSERRVCASRVRGTLRRDLKTLRDFFESARTKKKSARCTDPVRIKSLNIATKPRNTQSPLQIPIFVVKSQVELLANARVIGSTQTEEICNEFSGGFFGHHCGPGNNNAMGNHRWLDISKTKGRPIFLIIRAVGNPDGSILFQQCMGRHIPWYASAPHF